MGRAAHTRPPSASVSERYVVLLPPQADAAAPMALQDTGSAVVPVLVPLAMDTLKQSAFATGSVIALQARDSGRRGTGFRPEHSLAHAPPPPLRGRSGRGLVFARNTS